MVTSYNLPRAARAAIVKQNEVLDEIEQPLFGQHAVEQSFGVHPAFVLLCITLPLNEVLPLAGDRPVTRPVAIADYQESVVMERVGNAVLVQIIGEVVVKAGANISVHRLQLE